MTARTVRRRVTTRMVVASLPLVLAACAAPTAPTEVPVALPAGVVTDVPVSEEAGNDICTVRRSYPPSDRRPLLRQDRLVVGVDPSDATMSHWNPQTQTFEGFNIELVLEVARALWPTAENPREKIVFEVVRPGRGSFRTLTDQKVDMIATSLTASCERARTVVFSNDYLDSGQTALVRKVDGQPEFRGMEQLGGRRVCAAEGTTSLAAIAGYRTADGRRLTPIGTEHTIDCLVMLRQGQVDAVSTDENILIGFMRMAPDTTLVTEPPPGNGKYCTHHQSSRPCTWFTDEPHAFAFAPGREDLVRFVNHVLASTRASGVWQRAHDRWLRDHPDRGMPTPGPAVSSWPPD